LDCCFDVKRSDSGRGGLQFVATNTSGCLATDSVHSLADVNACGSHNAGTYWVAVGNGGGRGACPTNAFWLVNVGITNHYPSYPYAGAMFFDPMNGGYFVHSHLTISDDDQWCVYG
jgi:hypothetical protein